MDVLSATTNSPLSTSNTLVFGDNASEMLNAGVLNIHPHAIITVNSIADVVDNNDGVTTLREAINQANADSGVDLIVFERSLFSSGQTITLGLGELDITHSLDIIAPRDTLNGGDLVTLSGNNATRVFDIEPDARVNLSGLIISGGMANADNGGGIKNFGTLNLDSSIVRGNNAVNNLVDPSNPRSSTDGGDGGGIYNAGTLNLTNSTLNNNTAGYNTSLDSSSGSGGAIFNTGSVLISNSTLTGNTARSGPFGVSTGGTIFNGSNGNLLLRDSTISNSVSDGNGNGGAISNAGTADVTNSSVNGMVGGAFSTLGGGIYNSGTINLSYTSISGSSGSSTGGGSGGGIYNISNLTLSNSTVSNSSASGGTGGGGGIYNGGNAIATISNSTISNNTNLRGGRFGETGAGAGIYNLGTLRVSDSTITANSTLPGAFYTGSNGGGIFNGGNTTITNSTISGNIASGGNIGGGGISNSGNITLTNSTISGNTASVFDNTLFGVSGGGIYNSGSSIITNSTISGNTASTSDNNAFGSFGGGIYNSGTLGLLFDTIAFNQATNGGGVYNNTGSSTSLRNTIIADNTATSVNPDVFGNFVSSGYNLIGNATGSTGFDPALGDIIGSSDSPIDPLLGSLSNNGGSTQTIALLPGSQAIGAADPIILDTDPITDQRGLPRRAANGSADIGAFQFTL